MARHEVTMVLMLFLCCPYTLADGHAPALRLDAVSLASDRNRATIYVAVGNSSTATIEDIHLRLENGMSTSDISSVQTLNPGQFATATASVSTKSVNVVVVAEYKSGKTTNSIVRLIKVANTQNHEIFQAFGPVLGGGIAALAGTLVAAALTARRERARARFEWSKFLFGRYEAQYRQFFRFAGGTLDPVQIKSLFDQLDSNALVTPPMRCLVDEAVRRLSSCQATDRAVIRDALLSDLMRFVADPMTDARKVLTR